MILIIFFGLAIIILFTLALCKAASKDDWRNKVEYWGEHKEI